MVDQVYDQLRGITTSPSPARAPTSIRTRSSWGTSRSGESNNFVGYSNPEVDKLIEQGIAVTDQAERAKIYQEMQKILLEDLPWINLFVANQYEAMKTDVKGYVHIPTGSNIAFRETWLDAVRVGCRMSDVGRREAAHRLGAFVSQRRTSDIRRPTP